MDIQNGFHLVNIIPSLVNEITITSMASNGFLKKNPKNSKTNLKIPF